MGIRMSLITFLAKKSPKCKGEKMTLKIGKSGKNLITIGLLVR